MRSSEGTTKIVLRDSHEREKLDIFQELNKEIRARDIAVIFQFRWQKDPITRKWEASYLSSGPAGIRDMCIFCGWGTKRRSEFLRMGAFICHHHCHYDFIQVSGVAYLNQEDYRPALIIVPISVPGSLDNAIMDLAWGFAGHFISDRRNAERKITRLAEKIVRKMERRVRRSRVNWAKRDQEARKEPLKLPNEASSYEPGFEIAPRNNLANGNPRSLGPGAMEGTRQRAQAGRA